MAAWHGRHGWKWIGAPRSGVLGLFATPATPHINSQDSQLQDATSRTPKGSLDATQSTPLHPDTLPRALRLVLLGVEIVMALAAGLLCVWCASIARLIVRVGLSSALAECVYTAVFSRGLLAFFAMIFQQHDRVLLTKRLGLWWTPLSAVATSMLLHTAILILVRSHLERFTISELSLRALLLAPVEEELFFRGLLLHLALHRLRGNVLSSGVASSSGFALVHLANIRHLTNGTSTPLELLVQIAWAAIVGLFLALRVSRKGSLLECILLHSVNNVFAAVASASSLSASQNLWIGILSTAAYGLASLREFFI